VVTRDRCYDCLRPQGACFCAAIPSIANQTEVVILQHRRERTHPFNTARIVHKALQNSQLLIDHISNLAARLRLKPRAGLLFPGKAAQLISDLPAEQYPEQLIVLDGTWHHAKTLFREIPALHFLPQYRLAPTSPSHYRIRRAPSGTALSTIEAVATALQMIEPETKGFDRLLGAFDTMVQGQLAHAGSHANPRYRKRQKRTFKNIPLTLLGDLSNIVVAYGEAPAGQRGCQKMPDPPIYWVARRLVSGETFSCALNPPRPLDDTFLGHLELTRADFAVAVSLDEARKRWAQFCRPDDVVTVFLPGTARLFSFLAAANEPCLVLKSVDLESDGCCSTLDDFLSTREICLPPGTYSSRADKRLANTIALVQHLNVLGDARARNEVFRQPSPASTSNSIRGPHCDSV
jgi:DTW domain-containing protein YfiP